MDPYRVEIYIDEDGHLKARFGSRTQQTKIKRAGRATQMKRDRYIYLLNESNNERLSLGEIQEIDDEFRRIPVEKLSDHPDNALADDMLREIEAHLF